MKRVIFGIAAVLALTTASASASDEKPVERVARNTTTASASATVTKTAEKGKARSSDAEGSASTMKPIDVNAPHSERWLVEREGYRDGGY